MDSKKTNAILPQTHYMPSSKKEAERSSSRPKWLFAAVALILGVVAIAGACVVLALVLFPARPGNGGGHAENGDPMVSEKKNLSK